ncbi:MAG: IS66 family transposase, partial [Myxococcaceae bacterium]
MARRIDVTLDGLHQLLGRIEDKELVEGDWTICGALVLELILKMQGKQDRMAAKLAAAGTGAPAEKVIEGQLVGAVPSTAQLPTEHTTASDEETAAGAAAPDPKKKAKGHGRKGASAFVNAKHLFHTLAAGLVGALCSVCGLGRLTRYREKVVIRVVGQPLFAAECHHLEQARCRVCGRVVRAEAPTDILEGIGSSYTVYDWSACAMLIVMHYFAAAPFKRLESLHAGWGIPLADANLWHVVDQTDDLLLPLYRALELHGIQSATTLRIDDTGSMVLSLAKQIQAEIAALELVGESTRTVRTGINATGVLLESEGQTVVLFFTGRHHAGEVLDRLLRRRVPVPGRAALVKVTDGASKNFDHEHREQLVEASCNARAHGEDFKRQHALTEAQRKVLRAV